MGVAGGVKSVMLVAVDERREPNEKIDFREGEDGVEPIVLLRLCIG